MQRRIGYDGQLRFPISARQFQAQVGPDACRFAGADYQARKHCGISVVNDWCRASAQSLMST